MKNIILIKHAKNWGLSEELVTDLIKKVLKNKCLDGIELSLVFVGRKKAKDLNLKYRQKDYIPQVLGFLLDKEKSEDGLIHLGDIVICTEKLKYEVIFQNSSMEDILLQWLTHGVDNLLK